VTSNGRRLGWALALLLTGCSSSSPTSPQASPTEGTPSPKGAAAPAPVSAPAPAPLPVPADDPGPANKTPLVQITGGGSCHPSPSQPCTVTFVAVFSDPDGDPVQLLWKGCATGVAAQVTCVVTAPIAYTATVEARDGRGGFAEASATAKGTNLPPWVDIGQPRPPDPAAPNTLYLIAGGQPWDPDGDEPDSVLCGSATVSATGPCTAGPHVLCGGVGDVFDFDIRTLGGPGTCTVEARASDSWGAVGRASISFRVGP